MSGQLEKQKLVGYILTMSDIQNKLPKDLDVKHSEHGVCFQITRLNGWAFPSGFIR